LLALESLVVVFEIKPIYGLPIGGVDVVENTEINPNAVGCVERLNVGFLRKVSVVGFEFEPEADEPLTGCFLLDGNFFDVRFVRRGGSGSGCLRFLRARVSRVGHSCL
jgi:hypothetical protein